MKRIAGKILLGLVMPAFVAGMVSCAAKSEEPVPSGQSDISKSIYINVRTVNNYPGTVLSSLITEKIKTIRIIVLDREAIVLNEYKSFDNAADATQFSYLFSIPYSQSDNRRFYFIANEEQLTPEIMEFQPAAGVELPSGINGLSFSDIMNLYPTEIDEDDPLPSFSTGNAQELENILTSVYFAPYYEIEYDKDAEGEDLDTGITYLPYSVCYPEEMIAKEKTTTDDNGIITGYSATMYLVPVSTKFEFHFINNRSHAVELSDLTITQFDNLNFLMPRVGSSDQMKTFDSSTLYWPDWLAKVSDASWGNIASGDQSNTFNTTYGWISTYAMPNESAKTPALFPTLETPVTQLIPAMQTVDGIETPGRLDIGPFYMPESNNLVKGLSFYGLNFLVSDTYNNTSFKFENDDQGSPVAIENIGSLFRNTMVIINVEMGEGAAIVDGVYAEIMPYIQRDSWGFVGGWVK